MQIAICEDDPTLASILENHILEVSRDFADLDCEIDVYDCPTDYIKHHQKNYDLYFLDIEFDNCNTTGLDLARHLSEDPAERGQIIFVSSHPGYSIESIRYRPYRYLVKPVDRPQIETLFTELIRDFNADKSYIRFHRGKDNVYVHTSRILYVVNEDNRRLRVRYVDETEDDLFYCRTSDAEKMLPSDSFSRINKGMIVNLKYVSSLREGVITMSNGDTDVVSRGRKKAFEEALHRYLFQWKL